MFAAARGNSEHDARTAAGKSIAYEKRKSWLPMRMSLGFRIESVRDVPTRISFAHWFRG